MHSNNYQDALYYLKMLEDEEHKDILYQLHKLSLHADSEILQLLYEQGMSMAESAKDLKKTGLLLIQWAADQKHPSAELYLLNRQLEEAKHKYQHQDDYYKLIQQAEKLKIKLQKVKVSSEEQAEYDRLLEELELLIDDRKNYFKTEKRH